MRGQVRGCGMVGVDFRKLPFACCVFASASHHHGGWKQKVDDLFIMIGRVLESIKAGKRLPEARFANLSIAAKGQKSVHGLFTKPFRDPEV